VHIAALASGTGTVLAALIEADLPISVVIVDRRCDAEKIADHAGIAVEVIERTDFSSSFDRDFYTDQVVAALQRHEVDLIAMAGFGTVLGDAIQRAYPSRILNTHPALLPAFKGWHAVRDALAMGVKITGCTVHLATLEVDDGPILAQAPVEVVPDDTESSLHERIKKVERRLYPATIRAFISELEEKGESR
jgi:phosphoribosylglycinamide formyltransferase-1